MSLLGHGIDIIEISRVERLLANPHDDWLLATFSATERSLTTPLSARARFFAGRFAAKEAVGKALGTGISGDIAWTDIEILRDVNGTPIVCLTGEALEVANALGVTRWLISISHTKTYAVASVIAITT
jgi:holo-[acyl-carrier protein] synthase